MSLKKDESEIVAQPKIEPPKVKKEKVQPKIEKPVLLKFFVEFKVNVKGVKKEIGYIISVVSEDKIQSEVNIRAKKEMSGIRSITGIKSRPVTDEDKEYVRDVVVEHTIPTEPLIPLAEPEVEPEEQDERLEELLSHFVWRVVYTPGRKPRKRDYDKQYFVVEANTLAEAKQEARSKVEGLGLPYKEKWASFYKESLDKITKSSLYKQFVENNENQKEPDFTISRVADKIKNKEDKGTRFSSTSDKIFDDLNIETDNKYITFVEPKGVNIFDLQSINEYVVQPISLFTKLPSTKIKATAPKVAAAYMMFAIFSNPEIESNYPKIDSISCLNTKTNEFDSYEVAGISKEKLMKEKEVEEE